MSTGYINYLKNVSTDGAKVVISENVSTDEAKDIILDTVSLENIAHADLSYHQ